MIVEPVVSDLARQWINGGISVERYFAICRVKAEWDARVRVVIKCTAT